MIKNRVNVTNHTPNKNLLVFAAMIGLIITTVACGPASIAAPAKATAAAGIIAVPTNPSGDATSKGIPATGATNTPLASAIPQANQANLNPHCDALFLANYDMGMALAMMVNLTANTDYTAYTSPNSPFYLDFKKLRSELDTLATLPDPSATDALIVGKPSEAVLYFRQLIDLAEANIKDQGKPFVDTSPSGVKLIGIDTPWEKNAAVFGVAMGNVCQNYTAPSDLFSGTSVATVDPQSGADNNAAMATLAAASANMQATIDAVTTSMPDVPTETPAP